MDYHQTEVKEIARQAASPEAHAILLKQQGERIAAAAELLRLAALSQPLPPLDAVARVFGASTDVDRVAEAEREIADAARIITDACNARP